MSYVSRLFLCLSLTLNIVRWQFLVNSTESLRTGESRSVGSSILSQRHHQPAVQHHWSSVLSKKKRTLRRVGNKLLLVYGTI